MGMVVQHNMQAMNANRMLNITTGAQSKSTEKLSSGYRINRAADDAAGLTISEKMRKQIRGLDKASSNAQDGVSAVQTAEGALTEVHSMLQRMNELATQASNGTNSDIDRDAIQAEMDQLTTEIDRVSETTKFNETYLLKGDAKGATKTNTIAAHDAGLAGKLTDNGDGTSTFKLDKELKKGSKISIAGKEYTIGEATKKDDDFDTKANANKTSTNAVALKSAGDSVTIGGKTTTVVNELETVKAQGATWAAGDTFTAEDGTSWTVAADGDEDLDNNVVGISNVKKYLGEGATITKNTNLKVGIGTGEVAKEVKVVGELAEGTVSSTNSAKLDALRGQIGEGDTYTTAGITKTVYDATNATTGVASTAVNSFDDVASSIRKMAVDGSTTKVQIDGTDYTLGEKSDKEKGIYSREDAISMIKEGSRVKVGGGAVEYTYDVNKSTPEGSITKEEAYRKMADELTKASSIGTDEGKGAKVESKGDGSFTITQGSVEVKDALSFSLHVGADADMTNKINVSVESMSAAGLGIKGIDVSDDTGTAATYAIDAINDAISKVSSQRSALGAVQNRLEHTINNLDNVSENTQSAESRIRDTDIAKEMVEYSKNNILAQAGQSMLAQAKSSNQGVLSLLQ